jgi:Dolichyl-phosphate-mannose-protein mannosyltransferase
MTLRGLRPPVPLIVLVAVVPLLVLRPLQNTPFIDDWVYAWSVENLLESGELRILDWTTSLNVVQLLWGTVFCLPFGFSFTALRLSTWAASVLGLVGFYRVLRELGVSRGNALTGTALVGFYPVYFILSFTFMTDVPFLAAMIWSLWGLAHALRTRRDWALVCAAFFACLAIGIRPVGLILPGAMLVGLLFHSDRWGTRPHRLLLVAIPVAFFGLLLVARETLTAYRADLSWIEGSPAWRLAELQFGVRELHKWLAINVTLVVGTLGIALAPLALASIFRGTVRAAVMLASTLGVIFLMNLLLGWDVWHPLSFGSTWSVRQLGATEEFLGPLGGWTPPPWWPLASTAAAVIFFSLAMAPLLRQRPSAESMVLAWAAAGYFVLMAALWFFYDRYALPLFPLLVALRFGSRNPLRPKSAVIGVAALATISFVGTWDHLRYNEALWTAVDWLQRLGAEERDIDGGYVVNGWLQYAHPDKANFAPNGDVLVPGVNGDQSLRYTIRNSPPADGRMLHAVAYRRVLSPSGRIYIWERPRLESGARSRGCRSSDPPGVQKDRWSAL